MKKVFIAAILSMCCVTALMLGTGSAFTTIEDEGYAVPASAGIMRSLAEGGSAPISLVEVQYDDVIYSSITGYYIGETREQIDFTYPLYMKGGTGLRFLDDENWLITADVDLFQTFDGLYLSDGISYNEDMTQADGGEFILLALPNSGYMNAQQAVFENRIGERIIPTNSILSLSEDSISWYEQKNGTLAYQCEESVFDASLTIGSHTYHYADLLDALGLIREVIQDSDNKKPDPDVLQKADDILNGKKDDNSKKPWNNAGTAADVSGVDGEGTKPDETGDQGTGDIGEDPIGDGTDGPVNGGDDVVPGGSHENSAGEKDTPPENSGTTTGAEDGDAGKDDPSGEAPSGGSGDPDSGDTGTSGSMSGGDSATGGGSGASSGGSAGGDASSGGASDSAGSGTGGTEGSGGSSGDSSGQGSSSGSGAGTGGNTGEEPGDQPSGDEPGESGDPGESNPPPYQEPKVTLESVSPWCYALGVDLKIDDPSGAIVRGVSISVYKSIKKTGDGEPTTNEAGYKTYPSDGWEGKSTALRRTRSDSKPFALSTLEPGRTVYLQYSYRYGVLGKDPETGVETYERRRFYSNLIEITLPEVNESNVKTVSADWTAAFAAHADALELDDLTLANTSNYNADAEEYSFENFKLNTLPYVNRLKLTLIPDQGEKVEVVVGSAVLARAQQQKGVDFTSSTPKLASNTHYTYTVEALDRYGNTLPFRADGLEHGNSIYTCKATPEVTVTEKANDTGSIELEIEVYDPNMALIPNKPLRFAAVNSRTGVAAELYGTWDTGTISAGGEGVCQLELKNPRNGSRYALKIDSLAFSCLYSVEVRGDYAPQPDNGVAPETLPPAEEELLGKLSVYTAPLSTGLVSFQCNVDKLQDTSATLQITMTSNTTVDILELVDEFRVILSDKEGNVILPEGKDQDRTVTLRKTELGGADTYRYNKSDATVELQPGNALTPKVVLYGNEDQYLNSNPWDAFLIHEQPQVPEAGSKVGYTSPMQLQVILPQNKDAENPEDRGPLKPHTDYTFNIQAVVKKSGQEYQIPVTMMNNSFTTKKTIPQVKYSELFLAGDEARFLNLEVIDPDITILNQVVDIRLKLGNTIMAADTIRANDKARELNFSGLIEGNEYTLEFIAAPYNDEDGYGSYRNEKILETIPLKGGGALYGSLDLTELKPTADGKKFEAKIQVKATDIMGYLVRKGESGQVTMTLERSDSMELPNYKPYGSPFPFKLEKTQDQNGNTVYTVDEVQELTGLEADRGWRAKLTAVYQGKTLDLASIEFRSDKQYNIVSTHAKLLEVIKTDPYGNILVTNDFVQDQNVTSAAFSGTIDFQGHVVTRGDNITTDFLNLRTGGKVMNLVYDFPNQSVYENPAKMFSMQGGTVENLIVRTYGQIQIKDGKSLIGGADYQAPSPVLRNFIVQLGGDVTVSSPSGTGTGVIMNSIYGLVENGYVYYMGGKSGGGLIARGTTGSRSLFGGMGYGGELRNVYVVMDSWYETGASNASLLTNAASARKFLQHAYAVGDYYQLGAGEPKHQLSPSKEIRLAPNSASAIAYDELWALTDRSYDTHSAVKRGGYEKLYDVEWQRLMLGDAFDVDGCIPVNFYPRLKLPVYMQKYQEYLPLPILGQDDTPELLNDNWADDKHGLDSGKIRLRFQNKNGAEISDVKIGHLKVVNVLEQGAKDGMWDVIIEVEVDEKDPAYQSAYTVSSFSYQSTNGRREVQCNYKTTGIEFWKGVSSPQEWKQINDHMDWNYKLTKDLDFERAGLTPGEIMLNGTYTLDGAKMFTGRLDGQEYAIRSISLREMMNPYLIREVSGGEIKNLMVENLTIEAAKQSTSGYCGLIRYAGSGVLENIRMKDCTVSGGGALGLLLGENGGLMVKNCSAVESELRDAGMSVELTGGGLVGSNKGVIKGCYTRDVRIEIQNTTVVKAVGGLVGQNLLSIEDCYSHGSMKVAGSYLGGIAGLRNIGSSSSIRRVWSYVDILQTSGDTAGGLCGSNNSVIGGLAVGNVAGTGPNTSRAIGTKARGYDASIYAYIGQVVTGLAQGEKSQDVDGMLTGEDLSRASVWQDKIRLGSQWNYAPVEENRCMPKLAEDCSRDGWRQENIPLPGQADDPTLSVQGALYDPGTSAAYHYQVQAVLKHPSRTSEEIQGFFNNGTLIIDLDGMDMLSEKWADVKLSKGTEDHTTIIFIGTKNDLLKKLDTYALNVRYDDNGRRRDLTVMVEYKTPDGKTYRAAWEIPDLTTWDSVMPDHGKTSENIRITGTVDFGGKSTSFNELIFNRLEGANENCGFTNMAYEGGAAGSPWITKIGTALENISFKSMTFDFSRTEGKRAMTGVFLNVNSAENIVLNGITLKMNDNTRGTFGFIATAGGMVKGVTMSNVTVEDTQADNNTATTGDYCSALVARTAEAIQDVAAENIKMNAPNSKYVGAVVGLQSTYGISFKNISIETFDIVGRSGVGALAGQTNSYYAGNLTVKGTEGGRTVKGVSSVGGLTGITNLISHTVWRVENVHVTATAGSAGGIAGSGGHFDGQNIIVKDCVINGTTHVGGAIGSGNGYMNLRDIQVVGCTIENTTQGLNGSVYTAGGIVGLCSTDNREQMDSALVRDCAISGPGYVGGYMGKSTRANTGAIMARVYIAEDVTVTAREDFAGGLFGWADRIDLTAAACGATVTAGGSEAGGLIGHLEPQGGEVVAAVKQAYYSGKVQAGKDYAGGVVGKFNSGTLKISDAVMDNIIVGAADVRTSGEKISLWINNSSELVNTVGTGLIYIYEGALLNGQAAKAVQDTAVANNTSIQVVPQRPVGDTREMMVSVAEFGDQTFYSSRSFTNGYWYYEKLADGFMPFVRDRNGKDPLSCAMSYDYGEGDKAVGIKRPEGAAAAKPKIAVYVSGVDTINIETGLEGENQTVTIGIDGNETKPTADKDGVVTLHYDFQKDFTVNGVNYTADGLSRKVMTYGSYWYYIKDGSVHYGNAVRGTDDSKDDFKEKGTVSGIDGKVVHLWQGKALAGGKVYNLSGATASESNSAGINLTKLDSSIPFWSDGSGAENYYYFSVYNGSRLPCRVFKLEDKSYSVLPEQKVIHDGVILSKYTKYNKESLYFALLHEDGSLEAYRNSMYMGNVSNQGIKHISNNLGYSGTVLLAYYGEGNIVGVDYVTGEEVCSTLPATVSFFTYAKQALSNLLRPGEAGVLTSDGSFQEGEALQEELAGAGGPEQPGDTFTVDSTSINDAGGGDPLEGSIPENCGGSGDGQDGLGLGDGSQIIDGSSDEDGGSEALDGSGVGDGVGENGLIPGLDGADAEGELVNGEMAASAGSELPAEDGKSQIGSVSGEAGPEGTAEDGQAGREEPIGQSSDGGAAENGSDSVEQPGSNPSVLASGLKNPGSESGAPESSVSEQKTEEALRELFGDSVIAYSEKTGRYELLETASLSTGEPVKMVDALARKSESGAPQKPDGVQDPETPAGEDHFAVAWGINRSLYAEEKQGFLLIALAAGVGVIVLTMLYFKVIRKRKR